MVSLDHADGLRDAQSLLRALEGGNTGLIASVRARSTFVGPV
jgi:hypothetical protein